MDVKKYYNLIFYIILFLAFLVSFSITVRRYQYESDQNDVSVAMSLREIKQLAAYDGSSLKDVLERLKNEGHVTSISFEEQTLTDFVDMGLITVLKGSDIKNNRRVASIKLSTLKDLYQRNKVKMDYFYIVIDAYVDYERIRNFLNVEFGADKVKRIGSNYILEVLDDRSDLMTIGLGVSERDLDLVSSFGFNTIVRLKNSRRLNEDLIKQKTLSFSDISSEVLVVFEGDEVLGYPTQLDFMYEKIKSKQFLLGQIEFFDQRGMHYLEERLIHNIQSVHSIPEHEFSSYSMKKVIGRYSRAAKERSVDVLYVHPFYVQYSADSILDYNIHFLDQLHQTLIEKGLNVQSFKQYPRQLYRPATDWELFVLSIAVFSVFLFFINYFNFLSPFQLIISFSSWCFFVFCIYFFGFDLYWNKLMAFLSALFFPILAIVSQFPNQVDNDGFLSHLLRMVFYLFKLLCICFVSAFFIVSFLSDKSFLVNVDHFMGVKLSFVLPIFFIGLFFYLRPHRVTSVMFVLRRLYYAPVRTSGLISMIFLASFVMILIIRSGNTFVIPSFGFELAFRSFLEETFFVRPRTKEFLIGYPFLILSFLLVDRVISRHWVWFFNVIGSVALVSVVNSFAHLHTPLSISFYRTFLGLILGCVVAFIYYLIYLSVKKLISRFL